MSWSKESAAVGLGGLTPGEAAIGVLMLEDFQNIQDPLPDPSEEYGDLIQVIKVSNFDYNFNTVQLNNVDHVEQCILHYFCCSQRKGVRRGHGRS